MLERRSAGPFPVICDLRQVGADSVSDGSHALRGSQARDAPRHRTAGRDDSVGGRRASKAAFPRGAWERSDESSCGLRAMTESSLFCRRIDRPLLPVTQSSLGPEAIDHERRFQPFPASEAIYEAWSYLRSRFTISAMSLGPTTPANTEYNVRPITLGHECGCIEQGARLHGLPR